MENSTTNASPSRTNIHTPVPTPSSNIHRPLGSEGHPHFSAQSSHTTRPLPFVHPTHAEFVQHPSDSASSSETSSSTSNPAAKWSSRASRKNRYSAEPIHIHRQHEERADEKPLTHHSSLVQIEQRVRHQNTRMKAHFTWDISFWVAVAFVLGSSAWIVNGFLLYLPLAPTASPDHTSAAAAMAFVGGTLFEIGGYLMYVESLNTGHDELFGREILGLLEGKSGYDRSRDQQKLAGNEEDSEKALPGGGRRRFRWIGLGSWHDLGFLACFIQWMAASIFWISTLTGLPGIIPNLSTGPPTAIADVFFWTPQVIGGTGFIIASILLMLEEQRKWWLLNLKSLGWHIAVWNLVGALGFTLCGALGYAAIVSTKANYQSVMSTFWGSFAFMIGSVIQQWETLWREDPDANSNSNSDNDKNATL